jgi:hypothetical protein
MLKQEVEGSTLEHNSKELPAITKPSEALFLQEEKPQEGFTPPIHRAGKINLSHGFHEGTEVSIFNIDEADMANNKLSHQWKAIVKGSLLAYNKHYSTRAPFAEYVTEFRDPGSGVRALYTERLSNSFCDLAEVDTYPALHAMNRMWKPLARSIASFFDEGGLLPGCSIRHVFVAGKRKLARFIYVPEDMASNRARVDFRDKFGEMTSTFIVTSVAAMKAWSENPQILGRHFIGNLRLQALLVIIYGSEALTFELRKEVILESNKEAWSKTTSA